MKILHVVVAFLGVLVAEVVNGQEAKEWKEGLGVVATVTNVRKVEDTGSRIELIVNTTVSNFTGEDCFVKVVKGTWEINIDKMQVSLPGQAVKDASLRGGSQKWSADSVFLEGSGRRGVCYPEAILTKNITFSPLALLLDPRLEEEILRPGSETLIHGAVLIPVYDGENKKRKWRTKKAVFEVRIKIMNDGSIDIIKYDGVSPK